MSAHWGVTHQSIILPLVAFSGQLAAAKCRGRRLREGIILVRRAVAAAPKNVSILLDFLDLSNPAILL